MEFKNAKEDIQFILSFFSETFQDRRLRSSLPLSSASFNQARKPILPLWSNPSRIPFFADLFQALLDSWTKYLGHGRDRRDRSVPVLPSFADQNPFCPFSYRR